MLSHLPDALLILASPSTFLIILAAATAGFAIGAMPGLTATMGLAILVPFTFNMSPHTGLAALGGLYMGGIYGGAFPAILINTPGTPSSIATVFDGFPMTKRGRAEEAIVAATFASLVGGLIGVAAVLFIAPPLAKFALQFGPSEYFWIAVFGLTIIASLSSDNLFRGLISGAIGIMVGAIGIAPLGGELRFTFGITGLQGGVPFIPALIGLFTLPALCYLIGERTLISGAAGMSTRKRGVVLSTLKEIFLPPWNIIKSGIIGTVIGIIPGAGGNIASLVSYNEAKRSSKTPEEFGHGKLEGVVASESANNGVVGGGLVPLLTVGVPGAPPDAIILGALLVQGLRPGYTLFTTQADITLVFLLGMALAAILMVPVGLLLGRPFQRFVTKLPVRFLIPCVLVSTIVGSYAIRNNILDVWIMVAAGILGIFMDLVRIPVAPLVLGLILGPIAERGFLQGLLIGPEEHPWTIFFTRPLSLVIITLTILSLVLPLLASRRSRQRRSDH